MSYVLKQYNHPSGVDNTFLTFVTEGQADRVEQNVDSNVQENVSTNVRLKDECVKITGGLTEGVNYYFHGKIKRMSTPQKFDIKLINYSNSNGIKQYIKTIDIRSGNNSEWVDVDFIFTPAASFDTILFELYRIPEDFSDVQPRFPVIIYEELSVINNLITSKIGNDVALLKLGVQSHPGLMMCINGEQIYVGRTGIYELRNGVIKATMFSVVNPAIEEPAAAGYQSIEELQEMLSDMGTDPESTTSRCIFGTQKKRIVSAFTLDYMYERED